MKIFLTGSQASVAMRPSDLAMTRGVQSVQYSLWRPSMPIMVARLCLCLSVSY